MIVPLYAWVPMRYIRGMATRTRRRRRRTTTDPRRAVAYLRVSTDEQRNGPEAQRADIEAWAVREGVAVVAWHTDDGISGAAPVDRRPALLSALAELRAHGAGVLVVGSRDRLARDVFAAALLDRLVTDAGARIVSAAGEGSDGDDPAAKLQQGMADLLAAYERAVIAARTRAAMRAMARRGEAIGHPRLGFRVVDGRPVVDTAEAEMVARAVTLRGEGLSLRALAERLTAEGYATRAGRPHNLRSVSALLAAAPVASVAA
jgi:site-specific DNA recombinase